MLKEEGHEELFCEYAKGVHKDVLLLYVLGVRPLWLCRWMQSEMSREGTPSKTNYGDEEIGGWSLNKRLYEESW